MSDRAEARDPAEAAEQAVKAYLRMHREKLSADGELLSLLLPDRFEKTAGEVRDLQRFIIERLTAENTALKVERDSLRASQDRRSMLGEGVRRYVLDLIDARSFAEAISVAIAAAPAFSADRAAFCVEGDGSAAPSGTEGVRLIAPGTVLAVLNTEAGAILSGGGEMLLGPSGAHCRSLAAFRLKIGRDTPPALYVLGAREPGRFEGAETESDLRYFARALERAIRAWLDLPKI
jgi:uncharacterized protein YigA (DUF484 family)